MKIDVDLEGQAGIVTGAAQGIGRAYALGLAAQGASVVVVDLEDPATTVKEVEAAGGTAIGLRADITVEADVAEMAALTLETFGRIDFLVNNAAIYRGLQFKYWEEQSLDEWDRILKVNVRGVFQACRAVAPTMRSQSSGKIVNISSAAALIGFAGALHYVASKGAVIAMTRALATELGSFNVNVNCITPGFTMSTASQEIMADMAGAEELGQMLLATQCIKRPEQPEDLVGAVVFLVSPASDFISGQVINVDGGLVKY